MPYAPGIQYVGDRYYNQAIQGLGQNLADGIASYRKTKEESEALNSGMEAMGRAMFPLIEEGRIDRKTAEDLGDMSKFSGLSIGAKRAKFGQVAASFKMLLDEADKADRRREQEKLAQYRNAMLGQTDKATQERADRQQATFKLLMQSVPATRMQSNNTGVGDSYLEDAMAANPNADPEVALGLMKATQAKGGEDRMPGAAEMLQPFEIGGKRGLYNRRTGQMVTDAPAEVLAVPVKNAAGEVIGNAMPKGSVGTMIRDPNAVTPATQLRIRKLLTELQQDRMMAEAMKDPAALAAVDQQERELRAMLPPEKAADAPASAPAAQPRQPFQKGARVTQGGVAYEFDGAKWKLAR
jgi:hypothetical protein